MIDFDLKRPRNIVKKKQLETTTINGYIVATATELGRKEEKKHLGKKNLTFPNGVEGCPVGAGSLM